MTISVLVHYFALVAVMWMGAEALLMFRKVVIVFVRITTKYVIAVSLVCWCKLLNLRDKKLYACMHHKNNYVHHTVVPVAPVLASLIAELSNGDHPANDIIIRRTAGGSL